MGFGFGFDGLGRSASHGHGGRGAVERSDFDYGRMILFIGKRLGLF